MLSPCLPWRKLLPGAERLTEADGLARAPAAGGKRLALVSGPGVRRLIGPERALEGA